VLCGPNQERGLLWPREETRRMTIRSCRICGRELSDANKSPDLCFHHQTPSGIPGKKVLEARDAHETRVRGSVSVCTSRTNPGRTHAAIQYDGDPRNA